MKLSFCNLQKGIRYFRHYGFKEFLIRLKEKGELQEVSYETFCQRHSVTLKELERQRQESDKWTYRPFICCITTAQAKDKNDNKEKKRLSDELQKQSYTNWKLYSEEELCVQTIEADYLAFIEEGDSLSKDALYELAKVIAFPKQIVQSGVHWEQDNSVPDILYTDEDVKKTEGVGYDSPQFKPDYSPDMLESACYIRHLFCVSAVIAISAFAEANKQALPDMMGFIRECVKNADRIVHIPKVLYRACRPSDEPEQEVMTVRQEVEGTPLVSIIIPNKDEPESLKKCIASIEQSSYENYEIIVVENNSTEAKIFAYYKELEEQHKKVRIVTWKSDKEFNYSAINNYGVSQANGEYLVFLNNDLEIITHDWLEEMLSYCQRTDVAAVGAKLYYPDDTVQHAGIVIGIGGHARGVAANMCAGLPHGEDGYMHRASIPQNMSAVTAACMMMKKKAFDEVNGFTESLAVAFNDVDLCLKLRKAGYLIVYDPRAEAYHYESKSRGAEDTEEKVRRFQTEIEYMRTEWADILKGGDPYYNPNLTRVRGDYSIGR